MIGETRDLFWGYKVTSCGLVVRPNGTFLSQSLNNMGYWKVAIRAPWGRYKYYLVHRLVAYVFCGNPRPDIFDVVDHIDRNCTNNVFSNLRWVNRTLNNLNNDSDGCSFAKRYQKWHARVRQKTLGYFKKHEDAKACAKKHRKLLFDEIYHKLCHENHERCENTRSPSLICFSEIPKTARSPILSY